MRLGPIMLAAMVGTFATVPATAADQGQYSAALGKMLAQTAAGTCPADLMGDRLLAACREQLPAMRTALVAAGPVTAMSFVMARGDGATRIETYKVTFAKGDATLWHIGGLHDGKFETVYSRGD
jgi:hypothetical protein